MDFEYGENTSDDAENFSLAFDPDFYTNQENDPAFADLDWPETPIGEEEAAMMISNESTLLYTLPAHPEAASLYDMVQPLDAEDLAELVTDGYEEIARVRAEVSNNSSTL